MNKKSGTSKAAADKLVKTIRRKTRHTYSSEEKIRIVLAGLRGEENYFCAMPPRGISPKACITAGQRNSSKPGKRRLAGDTARQATPPEVKDLRSEVKDLRSEATGTEGMRCRI